MKLSEGRSICSTGIVVVLYVSSKFVSPMSVEMVFESYLFKAGSRRSFHGVLSSSCIGDWSKGYGDRSYIGVRGGGVIGSGFTLVKGSSMPEPVLEMRERAEV